MIVIKSPAEIKEMKKSCQLAAEVLDYIQDFIVEGTSTEKINTLCHNYIVERSAIPAPLNYRGFPKSVCTSVNEVVCHGIPDDRILEDGDIINVDVTTILNEWHGDTSRTFYVGKCSRQVRQLVEATEEALWRGIKVVKPGAHFGDIGHAIQSFIEPLNYSIVREYCGHGIGKTFHEDPHVVHYGSKGNGEMIKSGMTFTIEPMINLGKAEVVLLDDDWTVETRDRKLSAQFEHTIAVHEDHVDVLTISPKSKRDPIISW